MTGLEKIVEQSTTAQKCEIAGKLGIDSIKMSATKLAMTEYLFNLCAIYKDEVSSCDEETIDTMTRIVTDLDDMSEAGQIKSLLGLINAVHIFAEKYTD